MRLRPSKWARRAPAQHAARARRAISRACARGIETLETRCLLSGSDPVINEFLASNLNTSFLDDNGTRQDWIEIYNPANAGLNVGGWHLTDNKGNPAKSTFPVGTTIPGLGYLVAFADGTTPASG